MILLLRFIRKVLYEFFLRIHQGLALLSGYVLWHHLMTCATVLQSRTYLSKCLLDWKLHLYIYRRADYALFVARVRQCFLLL